MWIHIRIYKWGTWINHINVSSSQHAIFVSCICFDILYKNVLLLFIHTLQILCKKAKCICIYIYIYLHLYITLLYDIEKSYAKCLVSQPAHASSFSKHDDRLPVGHLALCNGLTTTSQRETLDRDKRGTLESNVKPWTPPKNKPSTSHKGWEDVFSPIGFWCQINFEESFCLFFRGVAEMYREYIPYRVDTIYQPQKKQHINHDQDVFHHHLSHHNTLTK